MRHRQRPSSRKEPDLDSVAFLEFGVWIWSLNPYGWNSEDMVLMLSSCLLLPGISCEVNQTRCVITMIGHPVFRFDSVQWTDLGINGRSWRIPLHQLSTGVEWQFGSLYRDCNITTDQKVGGSNPSKQNETQEDFTTS
jgi:hypothetical protein